jgi:hypothetical protein
MGWFSKADKSEAEQALAQLHEGTEADLSDGVFLTLTSTPSQRTPGSPLSVVNEGDPVRVGDPVQLVTFERTQETSIVALTQGGVDVDSLPFDERGEVVLDAATDLSEVYRTACLQDPGSPDTVRDGWFRLQVQTVAQRDGGVLVVGPARGEIRKGRRVTLEPWLTEDERSAKIEAVEPQPDGRLGLLLADCDAAELEYGDEVSYSPV